MKANDELPEYLKIVILFMVLITIIFYNKLT